jgi:hypothetical protein
MQNFLVKYQLLLNILDPEIQVKHMVDINWLIYTSQILKAGWGQR